MANEDLKVITKAKQLAKHTFQMSVKKEQLWLLTQQKNRRKRQ